MQELAKTIITEVERAVIGKRDKIERMLLAMTAGGHVLLEDLHEGFKTNAVLFRETSQKGTVDVQNAE